MADDPYGTDEAALEALDFYGDDDLLTATEVADFAGVHATSVRGWARSGRLAGEWHPEGRSEGEWRFRADAVRAFLRTYLGLEASDV